MEVVRSAETAKKDMPKSRKHHASIAIHDKPIHLPGLFDDH